VLNDLQTWERDRPADSPRLLVISSGSLEEVRRQGFRSRVLLDQNFAAARFSMWKEHRQPCWLIKKAALPRTWL
jgi:hypothetical protein